jgi:quercetin dioxygenase-like cupin family protein
MPFKTNTTTAPLDTELPRRLGLDGLKAWWLLNRDAGASERLEIHIVELPVGFKHGLHRHPNAGEVVYVLDGDAFHLREEGEPIPQARGDLIYIPAGEWHGIANAGDQPLVLIGISDGVNVYDDGGYEDHPSVASAGASE